MKLVIGTVRPEKANDVLEALYGASARGVLPTAVGFSMRSPGIFDGLTSLGLHI